MDRAEGEFETTRALLQFSKRARATTVKASLSLSDRKSKKVSPTFNKLVQDEGIGGTLGLEGPAASNTFPRVLRRQKVPGRSPDSEKLDILNTVARPRGILTRFPILLLESQISIMDS